MLIPLSVWCVRQPPDESTRSPREAHRLKMFLRAAARRVFGSRSASTKRRGAARARARAPPPPRTAVHHHQFFASAPPSARSRKEASSRLERAARAFRIVQIDRRQAVSFKAQEPNLAFFSRRRAWAMLALRSLASCSRKAELRARGLRELRARGKNCALEAARRRRNASSLAPSPAAPPPTRSHARAKENRARRRRPDSPPRRARPRRRCGGVVRRATSPGTAYDLSFTRTSTGAHRLLQLRHQRAQPLRRPRSN